jgi:hypothetical protein
VAKQRVSITSTSSCVFSMLRGLDEAWSGVAGYDVTSKINLKEVRGHWSEGPRLRHNNSSSRSSRKKRRRGE